MTTFNPKPCQYIMSDHMLNLDRCAVWAGMGMGKTSACLYTLDILSLIEAYRTLVVAPLRVARDVWPDEVRKWDDTTVEKRGEE